MIVSHVTYPCVVGADSKDVDRLFEEGPHAAVPGRGVHPRGVPSIQEEHHVQIGIPGQVAACYTIIV